MSRAQLWPAIKILFCVYLFICLPSDWLHAFCFCLLNACFLFVVFSSVSYLISILASSLHVSSPLISILSYPPLFSFPIFPSNFLLVTFLSHISHTFSIIFSHFFLFQISWCPFLRLLVHLLYKWLPHCKDRTEKDS